MTVTRRLVCDADLCNATVGDRGGDSKSLRRFAKRRGWVESRRNRQVVDYCAAHANLVTRSGR